MNELRLYLVCGLPGAGKTTRARELAARSRAVVLCADDWVLGLGQSLVDYAFRVRLQECLLAHAAALLRCGQSVILEFGSWHRQERRAIREAAEREGAKVELHFLDAPLHELARRVRSRGGPAAEALSQVLLQESGRFERPTSEETASFDRYVGPDDAWEP